jgi:hypothetical protein
VIKSMGKSMAITVAALLLMAATARASPVNPDLTISDLAVTYDGTNFGAVTDPSGFSFLSWTLPDGSFGGVTIGTATMTWNGTTGTFDVFDLLTATQLLSGTIQSLSAAVFNPGAVFDLDVLLSVSSLDLGDRVNVEVNSPDYSSRTGVGTGNADVIAAPEPGTTALLLLGGGAVAWRKRRRSMTPTQS